METKKVITMVNTRDLTSEVPCQRPIDPKRVKWIADNWDDSKMRPLRVGDVDGIYYVWDGQHTMAAALLLNSNRDLNMPCLIEQMTMERMMHLVATQYEGSKKHSKQELFYYKVAEGDRDAINIESILSMRGLKLSRNASINTITAIALIEKLYSIGPRELGEALDTITEAWPADPNRFKSDILGALTKLYSRHRGEFKYTDIVNKLKKYNVEWWITVGRSAITSSSVDAIYKKIIDLYNSNGRKVKLSY